MWLRIRKISAIVLGTLFLFASVVSAASANRLRNHDHGDALPAFSLPPITGGKAVQVSPGGKPMALTFFSIRPEFRKKRSLALLAALNELDKAFQAKVRFVAVFCDDDPGNNKDRKTIRAYMQERHITLPVLADKNREVHNLYGIFMMPLVVLIDAKGRLHEVIPYTYNIRELVEGNLRLLLGEWDKKKLAAFLAPKKTKVYSKEEKEFIRRLNYGKVMMNRKMYPQAIREFSTATKLMPKKIDGWVELGFAYLAMKKPAEAERIFRKALTVDSESDAAIAGLGLALYHQDRAQEALPELENAFIAPKPRLEVILALADLYERKGQIKKAIRFNKLAVTRLLTMYEHHWQ